jgi:hypothetical protein
MLTMQAAGNISIFKLSSLPGTEVLPLFFLYSKPIVREPTDFFSVISLRWTVKEEWCQKIKIRNPARNQIAGLLAMQL